ncbi:amidohydrolase family protein [Qipengyuania gelatinilytica]|uniref:Amidohydrolase family protein n=1 Tax=Qipengyuania gelatinilytica TaxID=2867231 RepID=A0ABX9A4M7_9SPHN|nr:amidohydrolase family protein [Qipengyuania gelatinilytica]QZD96233.1 amidohydrolase family protein [Qipengyuania gelatinilytica]
MDSESTMKAFAKLVASFSLLLATLAMPARADTGQFLLLRNVSILDLDGDEAVLTSGMSILIWDGKITTIATTEEIEPDTATRVIEGDGRIVMAGLVDMHVHIWDRASLGAYLAHGVTTVRNASGMPLHLRLASQIEKGMLAGPRLLTSGPILNSPGPNQQINHQFVTTAEEARAAVRSQHEQGYRHLKVHSNLTREAYEAVLDEAAILDMTVMGHTPEGVRQKGMPVEMPFQIAFEEILDDGLVTIEHVESIVWHGLRDRHDEAAARELAKRIAAANVPVDATLLAFYNLLRVAETNGEYLGREGTGLMSPLLVATSQAEYDRWSNEDVPRNRAAFEFYKLMTKYLSEEGVLLVAGSDAGIFTNVPGMSLIDELELLEEAGLDRTQVLRAATINPAIALGEEASAGRVAEGHRADLILLDDDPTKDLASLRSVSAVVAGGDFHDRAALDAMLVTAAEHDIGRTQANLVEALKAQGTDPAALGL